MQWNVISLGAGAIVVNCPGHQFLAAAGFALYEHGDVRGGSEGDFLSQLLAFLALQGGEAQSREKLAALLWADRAEAQARDSLRQSLAALRRANPRDDLVSIWANSECEGEKLTDADIISEALLVLDGGAETTRAVIATTVM